MLFLYAPYSHRILSVSTHTATPASFPIPTGTVKEFYSINSEYRAVTPFEPEPHSAGSNSLGHPSLERPVTFTATVTESLPTGRLQFKDGANSLGSPVALVGGQAQLSVADLTVGGSPHSITAVYSGDENNALSTSSAVEHSVTAPN